MNARNLLLTKQTVLAAQRRLLSDSTRGSKRYLQTIQQSLNVPYSYAPINNTSSHTTTTTFNTNNQNQNSNWNKHTLPRRPLRKLTLNDQNTNKHNTSTNTNQSSPNMPSKPLLGKKLNNNTIMEKQSSTLNQSQTIDSSKQQTSSAASVAATGSSPAPTPKKRRRQLRPRKALITLTPTAINHLKGLMDQPNPQYIKIGVKNRGCSGLSYNLEYVSKPEKFDEIVKIDDDVMIIIDSKALFSIIGSEMDYVDDKLSNRFVFKNPNSKGSCGCGESFMV